VLTTEYTNRSCAVCRKQRDDRGRIAWVVSDNWASC